MGVYRRQDSRFWWLHLETAPKGRQRVPTKVLVGDRAQEAASRKIAERVYFAKMGELATDAHGLAQPAKAAASFNAFADWYDQNIVPSHRGWERERGILKHLRAGFGSMDMRAPDWRDTVIAWRSERAAKTSASNANRETGLLRQMMAAAVPKYFKASPLAGLRRLKVVPPNRRLLWPDEEKRLLKVATDPQDRGLIILGLDTLMRLSDLLSLRRADRKGVWLYVAHPKGGDSYEVPLSPRAAAALDAIPNAGEHYFAKFRKAAKSRHWRESVRQRMELLCAAATPPVPYGRNHGGVTFHWMTRRTGATRLLVDKGQPVTVVQQLGNWKTADVLLRIYSEAQRSDLLKAVGSVESVHVIRSRSKNS